ncbi:diguanylate cyclase [Psychromonas sp.]|nr:diguanylate cyclase [Psychromonas sp.]
MESILNTFNEKLAIKHWKRKRGLLYAMILTMFLLLVLLLIHSSLYDQIKSDRETEQYSELFHMQSKIVSELNSVGSDLSYYAHSDLAIDSLASRNILAQKYLISQMYNISLVQQRYEQMRLLDLSGNEVIRINKTSDSIPQIVSESMLQNKADRYYFQEALRLKPYQVYVSKFDLNIENEIIEVPYKPVIRFATPVHDKNKKLLGVAVMNYNGKRIQELLDDLNIHNGDQVFLLNHEGYYLKSNTPETEWGAVLPERASYQFSKQHPNIWSQITSEDRGHLTDNSGEYYFSRFYLSPSSPFNVIENKPVLLVMHIPAKVINKSSLPLFTGLLIAFVFLFPLLAWLGWLLGGYQVNQIHLYKQMEFEARFDALTGLFNRKAITDCLQENINLSRRRGSKLSLGFIDVNDLKKMNDEFGHEAGDRLIKGAATVINKVIRMTDSAGRLGGDEFLVVFIDCAQEDAHIIMRRIKSEFYVLGSKMHDMPWSLSYGCTELLDESDSVSEMIRRADIAMYKNKMAYKDKNSELDES